MTQEFHCIKSSSELIFNMSDMLNTSSPEDQPCETQSH